MKLDIAIVPTCQCGADMLLCFPEDAEGFYACLRQGCDGRIPLSDMKPCDCGCGRLALGGMMEWAHPEDFRGERG